VSRRHASILVDARGATLEDLGSRNGTLLNGRPLTAPAPLADGDEIGLGAARLGFRAHSAAADSTEISLR
jgi:pSer/pThr/pTyr-binding forkhead associated (FHA) protein